MPDDPEDMDGLLQMAKGLSANFEELSERLTATQEELEATRSILALLTRQLGGGVRISSLTINRWKDAPGILSVTSEKETGDLWVKMVAEEELAADLTEDSEP